MLSGSSSEDRPASAIRQVEGPNPDSEGFIVEFLDKTNKNDGVVMLAGDTVDLQLSCPGYKIGPVLLQEYSEPPQDWYKFRCNVELHPEDGPKPTLPSAHQLTVAELLDKDLEPISFTTEPIDPLSDFIQLDQATGVITLSVIIVNDPDTGEDDVAPGIYMDEIEADVKLQSSPFLEDVWDKYQSRPVSEGVIYEDDAVPEELALLLNQLIGNLAAQEDVDWHPGSNECVRDLVHPSLFPYINGVSPLNGDGEEVRIRIDQYEQAKMSEVIDRFNPTTYPPADRFGRLFEVSNYRWLPSVFRTDADGKVSIEGYINNLDEIKYAQLYKALARLFEVFLPRFEQMYAYVREMKILPHTDDLDNVSEASLSFDFEEAKLRNMGVRVITKIVDYELAKAEDKVEGVWHVEGMSSDYIIMTGVYVLTRDEDFDGGTIEFKRTFWGFEGQHIYFTITQCRHPKAEEIVDNCMKPLGTLDTPQGRLIVFPNSHVHRLSVMRRIIADGDNSKETVSRRRVIVFWVVDPERDVITTKHVAKQQGGMSMADARQHRLQLMQERKMQKGKLNGERPISLCEH